MSVVLIRIGVALGLLQTAVPVAGVPIAAGIALDIVKTCQGIAQQKDLAKSLGEKCVALANALQDESSSLEGTALQARIDEVVEVLKKTLKCTKKWRNQTLLLQRLRRIDMAREIEQCHRNLDNAIKEFEPRNQISIQREQKDAREENTVLHMESREILLKIFESQVEMQRIVTLHQAGQPAARDLMKNGQEMLREIRLELQGSTGPGPSSAPSSSSAPNRQVAAQQCREMQRGLAMLHRMTAIPPSNKILDGEVRKTDNLAIAGGSSSDIWRGLWLDEVKVALKGMRSIRIDDKSAQKRFVREIEVWSRLDNEHILQFYGIATDLGPHIHIVCSWLENGGVLEYTKKHPDTDKMHLIRGAAEGLKYLHSENVTHGNIKCSNILVSGTGEACISDFGMAKVLEDVTKTPASTTLARSGNARWLAPEVVEGDPPSQKSDTYSFGMTVLELITGKNPFPQYKTDAAVIRALMSGVQPKRPTEPADQRWLTDDLWDLIEHCLAAADARPTMQDFLSRLGDLGTNYESPVKRPTLDTKLTIEGTITALPEPPPPTSGPTGFLHTLALILGDKETRGTLQKLEGERAQLMIDYLDSLLGQAGFEDPGVRKLVLQSLCRLSAATMRYPQRYALEGIDNIVARGGGGFCDIYQARHGERDLCLKAVRLFQASSKEIAFGLYSEEASLWGQLRHPNIVPFYGIFHLKDLGSQRICLVSPWMEKGTIIQYLEANRIATNDRKPFLYDIACGLQYLHEKRIVHADLKGDNILINDSGRACITDFGLSTIWNEMTVENMSVSDVRGQTWRYCSPELVNDAAPSPVNDIWAFGMVCYEIMTRKRPYYESKTDRQIIMRITKGDLPTRPTGNESDIDQIDDVTWDLMQSCWAKESKERPTCEQILRRPELAGFAKEGEGDYVDYKTEEKWQFHHATPSRTAAGGIEEILNELKQI